MSLYWVELLAGYIKVQEGSVTMSEEEIIELLRTRLSLNVVSDSNYTGGLDGSGSMYADSINIQLLLDGEVISEDSLP